MVLHGTNVVGMLKEKLKYVQIARLRSKRSIRNKAVQ